jgi:translocator protein
MILPFTIAASTVLLMLGVGTWMTTIGPWYRDLRKPTWNPPNWVFGPAWTVILGLAAWSGWFGPALHRHLNKSVSSSFSG